MMQIIISKLVLNILNKLNDEHASIADDVDLEKYIKDYLTELEIPNEVFVEIKKK